MEGGKCDLEKLSQKMRNITKKIKSKVDLRIKISNREVEELSGVLRDFTIKALDCNGEFRLPPTLNDILELALNESNFENPVEAKTYLYPYLVVFFDEIDSKLDEILENPEVLMAEAEGFPLFNLAEKFLELQMMEALRHLIIKVRNINSAIALKLVINLSFLLVTFLRQVENDKEELVKVNISSLEYFLDVILEISANVDEEAYIDKLSYIVGELPPIMEILIDVLDEEQIKTISMQILGIAIKYKNELKEYFEKLELKLLSEARPQYLMVIAKVCNLLYRLGAEELIPKKDILKIIREYGYSLKNFESLYKQDFRDEKLASPTLKGGIILSYPSREDLFEIAKDSVFLIEVSGKVGNNYLERIALGTCFIYKQIPFGSVYKLYFLTNLHNVHGIHPSLNLISKLYRETKEEEIDLNFFVNIDGQKYVISEFYVPPKEVYEQVLLKNPLFSRFDFAVFTLKSNKPRKFFGLKQNSVVKEGETVYAFGYPQGLALSMSEGIVSHVYINSDSIAEEHSQFLGTIQHTVLINPGNSGGPTVKENGELAGISTFGLSTGVGLNFSIDIRFISTCLQDRSFFRVFKVRRYIDEALKRLKAEKSLFA